MSTAAVFQHMLLSRKIYSLVFFISVILSLQHSYVYVFDGNPAFLDTGLLQSDRSLLGAFCGRGRGEAPLTVEATTGTDQ